MKKLAIVMSALVIGSVFAVGCSAGEENSTPSTGATGDENEITSVKQCKGALPAFCKICDDGSESCAHWGVKNGVCEIETCAAAPVVTPPATPDAGAGECKAASDCHGMLPHIIETCKDGTTAGAHFACNAGKCGIEICPK